MIVTSITRSYSRSINTKNYGAAESWVKVEAAYTAQIESGDDPIKVSSDIAAQAQAEVAATIGDIISKIRAATVAAAPAAGSTTPPPATGAAPRPL